MVAIIAGRLANDSLREAGQRDGLTVIGPTTIQQEVISERSLVAELMMRQR